MATQPLRSGDDTGSMDDEPASKAEFVWLMLELARLDRDRYREFRESCWMLVAMMKTIAGKSEQTN